MTYPANFLEDRIRAVVASPSCSYTDPFGRGNSPAFLVKLAVAWLSDEGMTKDQAIATLASKGESYGTAGELGGINVYIDDLCFRRIEWTTDGDSIYCSLASLLAEAEADSSDLPHWFRPEWTMIQDLHGGWIRLIDRP